MTGVTVAIPTRDGGLALRRTLAALARQTVEHELLVCDSGSRDASVALARSHGARVLELPPQRFNHGATRNLLMQEASGEHVALLTQDAEPASERWLERLLASFELADDIAIAYGPYLPRSDASPAVRLELERWFRSLSPDGAARVDRLDPSQRELPGLALMGRRGFFTDANACVSRAAWRRVPFRAVPYAEDRLLALDMLRAGYAKVFAPDAGVLHSHDYGWLGQLRRSFDEGRGLREVYGWREPASPRYVLGQLRGELAGARSGQGSTTRRGELAMLASLARHQLARLTGAILGSRADRLPAPVRRCLSLERRDSFLPLELDRDPAHSRIQDPRA